MIDIHNESLFNLSGDPKLYRVKSPLNYIGGKHDLLKSILRHMPDDIDIFVDAFCGGLNVGANAPAKSLIAIDSQKELIGVLSWIRETDPATAISVIYEIVDAYGLGKNKKSNDAKKLILSSPALIATDNNNETDETERTHPSERSAYDQAYRKLRDAYNEAWGSNKSTVNKFDIRACLYTLIVHGFNSHIRFGPHGYNIPFGDRTFNSSTKRNLKDFATRLQYLNTKFMDIAYDEGLKSLQLTENSYVYADPPYSITMAPYNTQWTTENDSQLFETLDKLNQNNIRFGLSNVFRHSDRVNEKLLEWSKSYIVYEVNKRYDSASYNIKPGRRESVTTEVFITNYDASTKNNN